MRVGVKLPTSGPLAGPEALRAIGVASDRLGYDSVWVQDHVTRSAADAEHHFAVGAWEAWPRPIVPNIYESMSSLVYLAGLTQRVLLGTSAVVLPLRNPVWLAKEAACLDQLSEGRLVLGVVVGGAYVRQELAAIGESGRAANRGLVTDEWIEVIRGVWREPRYSHGGRFIDVADAEVFPKPKQAAPPIWVGGTSPRARDRVARRGDGWLAIWLSPDEFRAGRADIVERAARYGRPSGAVTMSTEHWMAIDRDGRRAMARSRATRTRFSSYISTLPSAGDDNVTTLIGREDEYSLVGDPAQIVERLRLYAAAGADHVIIRVIAGSTAEAVEALHMFRDEVRPHLTP
jgi:probable F420-dependent oxidoreductase